MFRPMRRFNQQLTHDACISILSREPRGVLALAGDDGYPYAVPMDFVYDDGHIYFHSALAGHKMDAVRRCDKVSFCVLDKGEKPDDDWAYFFNSVIVFGRMRILSGDEKERGLRLLGQKYFPSTEMVEEDIKKNAARCHCLCLDIEHISGKRVHER